MTLDGRLREVLADLESHADGVRPVTGSTGPPPSVEDASVDLVSRMHASVGEALAVRTRAGARFVGVLTHMGSDYCVLRAARERGVVRCGAIARVEGLTGGWLDEAARPLVSRLSVRAALRRLVDAEAHVVVHLGAERCEGQVARVGRDFLELDRAGATGSSVTAIPFGAIDLVRVPS
ncbi:MAG: hypothetical protein ACRDPH_09245 [Marmoricola sp.]